MKKWISDFWGLVLIASFLPAFGPTDSFEARAAEPGKPAEQGNPERAGAKAEIQVTLEATPGAPPGGFTSKSGWPFPLKKGLPPGTTRVPESKEAFFGEIPLAEKPVRFVVFHPAAHPKDWVFQVDADRDGDFTNDSAASYPGEGTYGSAAGIDVDVLRPDGTRFPVNLWVYTNLNDVQGHGEKPAFNYYSRTVKSGVLELPFERGTRKLSVLVADPNNEGRFDSHSVFIDLNGDGKFQDAERFGENACTSFENLVICVEPIAPFGDSVRIHLEGEVPGSAPVRDAGKELEAEPMVGKVPPALGKDLSGNEVSLERFEGKVVLIDFWATWCGPCMKELPGVLRLYGDFHARGLEIVGVSLDRDRAALEKEIGNRGIPWPQICDFKGWDSEIARRFHVDGIPFTFLIGKDGKIAAMDLIGEQLAEAVKKELQR